MTRPRSTPPKRDAEIDAIASALSERGLPHAELGRRLGLDSSQVSRLFSGRRRLQRHELATIRAWLWPGIVASMSPVAGAVVATPGMVPLYGWIKNGGGNTFSEENVRAYVPMQPSQQGTVHPFALEVADVSMSPRYEPGEIVYVAPNRWPTPGQDAVIVCESGEVLLRRYLRRTETVVYVAKLNPPGESEIALDHVAAIHAVTARG